ncbi:MAG: metallophosphoesterase [Pseudomonadota bacterium]
MKFIHVSDLHYHRDPADNKDADDLLKGIHNDYPNHFLIVTGDITDDGHETQYENAYAALARFKGRLFMVPGNHDFGAAGNFYSRERAVRFDEMLMHPLRQGGTFTGDKTPVVSVLEDGSTSVMVIGLDSNLETLHLFDFACGEIGDQQLSALDTVLSTPGAAGKVRMVFFHHHPFMHGNPFMELLDGRGLMRTLYGRADVVLFGHKHVSKAWENRNGIRYVLASDNSPSSASVREITVDKERITVQDIQITYRSGVM